MSFYFSSESFSLLPGLSIFEKMFPQRMAIDGTKVKFVPGREALGFSLARDGNGFSAHYARPCDAYRALGFLLSGEERLSQTCAHESVGVMWDVSRNAVLRVEAWKKLLQKFALLGINSVQIYMEDVYQLPGEPFFGYGRGAYSTDELREIDAYAQQLDIEMIPCIQTLGHLHQITQWPAYQANADVSGVLMVGEDQTRHLIGKMLTQMSACFRSRKIHVGMDEAFGVGTGKYLEKNGRQPPFDILLSHLQMVVEMCRERGLQPMIWSDMFFRMGSAKHDYYDRQGSIPESVAAEIPSEVELVYWDYYHADSGFYEEWIQRHRIMGKEPIFAAGAWNWGRFWAYAPRWRESIGAGMKAARKQKLASTLLTLWGDDGAECHPASVFPALQYFAECAYAGELDDKALARHFAAIFSGASLSDYLLASKLDDVPSVQAHQECTVNYSKWILWHDPILGFLNAHITADLPAHYRMLADALAGSNDDEAVKFARQVAHAVALKSEIHLNARAAWKARDYHQLNRLLEELLPECLKAIRKLWQYHRIVWMHWNKPFGWEVLEYRYAGIVARLESLGNLLEHCLQKMDDRVPEWEGEELSILEKPSDVYFNYHSVNTPSALN